MCHVDSSAKRIKNFSALSKKFVFTSLWLPISFLSMFPYAEAQRFEIDVNWLMPFVIYALINIKRSNFSTNLSVLEIDYPLMITAGVRRHGICTKNTHRAGKGK